MKNHTLENTTEIKTTLSPYQAEGTQAVPVARPAHAGDALLRLQRQLGNRFVQRVVELAQRQSGGEGFTLDDETAGRINRARGGQPLDGAVQAQMREALGFDFSGVRVHTDSEADELNQQLQAKAFATGPDIFFRQGEYNPGSSGGRKLIAHELSHVVQQSSGRVSGDGGGMTVRPACDAFEQEAQSAARSILRGGVVPHRTPVSPFGVQSVGRPAIQLRLDEHITPEGLTKDHPNVVELSNGKVVLKATRQGILCTQAVGLAKRGESKVKVTNIGDLVTLQNQVRTEGEEKKKAGQNQITLGKPYMPPQKVVHWFEGDTHKHSAVVTEQGLAAGFNQGDYVRGGKKEGLYNKGKVLLDQDMTVWWTD